MGKIFNEDGSLKDADALKQVNFGSVSGSNVRIDEKGNKVVTIPHSDDGKPAGEQIYHPDGRISANVLARTVEVGS